MPNLNSNFDTSNSASLDDSPFDNTSLDDSPPWDVNFISPNPIDAKMPYKRPNSIFDMMKPTNNKTKGTKKLGNVESKNVLLKTSDSQKLDSIESNLQDSIKFKNTESNNLDSIKLENIEFNNLQNLDSKDSNKNIDISQTLNTTQEKIESNPQNTTQNQDSIESKNVDSINLENTESPNLDSKKVTEYITQDSNKTPQKTSNSQALALKYRPKTFKELIGQDSVAKTLSLALDSEKIANAYLFSGLRGSGKTSSARIFARCLECEKKITSQPCGTCTNCKEALKGTHIDIIELDGASNRGIDAIRDLIEQTKYRPVLGRFKVFIIDEVHMLTKEAFNSLLKTLEEPPGFVKFILATTDPLKLPPTILSRTQHYRFKQIPTTILKAHLESIIKIEGVSADNDALNLLIRNGSGSVRDTLTLLDQAIVYCSGVLTSQKVATMLGSLDLSAFDSLFNALLRRDMAACVAFVREISGFEIEMILDTLSVYIREKMLLEIPQIPPILGMRYGNIIADSKAMLHLDCDGEFCLLLCVLKMFEAQKLTDITTAISQIESSVDFKALQDSMKIDSNKATQNIESNLDSKANEKEQVERSETLKKSREAQTAFPPVAWCEKSGEASSSASADFSQATEERGSPPFRQKSGSFFSQRGSGEGDMRFFAQSANENQENDLLENSDQEKLDSMKSKDVVLQNSDFGKVDSIESKNVDVKENMESTNAHSPSLAEGDGGWVKNPSDIENQNIKDDSKKLQNLDSNNLDISQTPNITNNPDSIKNNENIESNTTQDSIKETTKPTKPKYPKNITEIFPQNLDSNFQTLIAKIYDRDFKIGELFEKKVRFNGINGNDFRVTFFMDESELDLLRKGYKGLLALIREVFGEKTALKVDSKESPQALDALFKTPITTPDSNQATQSQNTESNQTQPQKDSTQTKDLSSNPAFQVNNFMNENKEILQDMKAHLGVKNINIVSLDLPNVAN